MTAAEQAPGWPAPFPVALTGDEVRSVLRLRGLAGHGNERAGWRLFACAIVVGAVAALLAIVVHLVPVQRSAGVAVGGFLACQAGMWLYSVQARRAGRAVLEKHWDPFRLEHIVALDAAGISLARPDGSTRAAWSRTETASLHGGLVVLRSRRGWLAVLPGRCLPPGWTAEGLVAAMTRAIASARPQALP